MKSLENRIKQLEEKLKPKSKIHTVVDWSLGDGEAERRIAEIKKADPEAKIEIIKVEWV
jgi:hypothetical protein